MNHKINLAINYKFFPNHSETACYDVPIPSDDYIAFDKPIQRLSDPVSAAELMIFRPTPELEILKIMKNRKVVAKRIAECMTEFLLDQMTHKDTLNGYPDNKVTP